MAPVYILGDVFTAYDGWSVGTPMNVVGEYTYEFTADLGIGSFIVCGVDHLSSEGTKLKNNKGSNFAINVAGNWTLRITREDKSQDPAWLPCSEANQGIELAQAYYQLIPNFEIIVATTIEKLYLNGDAVGGWNNYVQLTKVNDSLYQIETILIKLLEGSNLYGYGGISIVNDDGEYKIIRPLLCVSKSDLYIYANDNKIL